MTEFFTIKRKALLCIAGLLLALNFFAWQEVFTLTGERYLTVVVTDIGQGDAIFIETPNKRRIIIDGGPSSKILEKIPKFFSRFDKSLDMVILTHPDADHLVGLLHVLKRYPVDYIVWSGVLRSGTNYRQWLDLIENQEINGAKMVTVKAGDKIINGEIVLDILHPFEDLSGKFFSKDINDTGVVARLSYQNTSFMLTGDITSVVEKNIVSYYDFLSKNEFDDNDRFVDLRSDVLKVAHHGSKTSSSQEFLVAVDPSFAVIPVGRGNSYGHPAHEVLQRLERFGITVFRTDRDGDIVIISDGETIKVKLEN